MLDGSDVFLLVASASWQHLTPQTRKALRASCLSGRQLHDSLWEHLRLDFGVPNRFSCPSREKSGKAPRSAPTPSELRSCVSGVLQRGARLRSMTLSFQLSPRDKPLPLQEREQQLLAVLNAIRGHPIPTITISGSIPTTVAVADAMADACSHLQKLTIVYPPWYNDLPPENGGDVGANAYAAGVVQLLTVVGPRLREMRVTRSAPHWTAEAYEALRHCTGLTSLTLEAGRCAMAEERDLSPAATEACMVNAVAQLTSLRSLQLRAALAPASSTPEDVGPHAISVACLSALTALTSLELDSSRCYELHGDRWSVMHNHGLPLEDTCEAHRTSLLSALRAMPHLQDLCCPTLWLRPSEVAPLIALTSLSAGGLLPPSPPGAGVHGQLAAGMGAAPGHEAASASRNNIQAGPTQEGPLPAGLKELRLSTGASPCTLAALQLPASIRSFHCCALILGFGDVEDLEYIKEETLQALGPAVRLLSRPETRCARERVQVVVDGGPGLLQPRQDTPAGHVEWLRQLAGLGAFDSVVLSGVELRVGDVACLVRMWPNLQTLNLRDVAMPMATLPMLAALTNVMDVTIDVSRMKYVALDELEAALCMLGLQAGSNLHWINVVVDDAYADELGFADDVRDYLEGLGKGHVCLAVVPLEDSVGYR